MHQACHCSHIAVTPNSWKCWLLPTGVFVKMSVVRLTNAVVNAMHAMLHWVHSALVNLMRIAQADAQELHAVGIT